MSALGQKQRYAPQKRMSALLPKADMCGATCDVRFGPIADISQSQVREVAEEELDRDQHGAPAI
jgi:hypothetical protein